MMYNTRYLPENFEQCRLEKTILRHFPHNLNGRPSWNALIQDGGKNHDKNGILKERHLYTVWIYLTTGRIAFQGPNYQDVIDNNFPVLKRIVTDKVGLISNVVQHEQ